MEIDKEMERDEEKEQEKLEKEEMKRHEKSLELHQYQSHWSIALPTDGKSDELRGNQSKCWIYCFIDRVIDQLIDVWLID